MTSKESALAVTPAKVFSESTIKALAQIGKNKNTIIKTGSEIRKNALLRKMAINILLK